MANKKTTFYVRRYIYDVHFERVWELRQKWDVIGSRAWPPHGGGGVSECCGRPIFFWAKYWDIIDKKSSFCLWRQTVKPSFNYTLALFVGLIEQQNAWSIWKLRALFWFCLFTYTLQLLSNDLFTFSSCANKTGWLQNKY